MQDVYESRTKQPSMIFKHHIEPLIIAVRINSTISRENSTHPKKFKKQDNKGRINNWRRKKNAWIIP